MEQKKVLTTSGLRTKVEKRQVRKKKRLFMAFLSIIVKVVFKEIVVGEMRH